MEEAEAAVAASVQNSMSADGYIPQQKIGFEPNAEKHAHTKSPEGGFPRVIPRPPSVATSPSAPGGRNHVLDYIMKSRDSTPPPLSSSDVLMTSFNVLEEGDPVRHCQTPGQRAPPGEHQPQHQQQYVTSTAAPVSWSEGTLVHNSNSIMRALTEPHSPAGNEMAFKNPSSQAVYTTSIGQRLLPTPRLETQWSHFDGDEHSNFQYAHSPPTATIQDLSTSHVLPPTKKSLPQIDQPVASTVTSQGTLTRAVKETFFIAHFSCTHCTDKFRIPERLAEHVKTVHSGSIVYTCFTCGLKFFNSYDLREHVATHASEPIKCSLCSLVLSSSKELRNHHKTMHPMSSISCLLCEKIFANTLARAKHLAIDHQNDNRLTVCDLCGDAFLDQALYEVHCKTHQSAADDVTLPSKETPQSHAGEIPKAVVIWKCDKCGIIFPNDKELNAHKEVMHRDDISLKPTTFQGLRNAAQEKSPILKPVSTDLGSSRYELLRLLLARRMASSSSKADTSVNMPVLSGVVLDLNSNAQQSAMVQEAPRMQQQVDEPQQGPAGLSRGPGILSVEAMQHVADELSILKHTMNKKKHEVDTFLANRNISVTADMMIDSESTIGINLAIKKNTSQDVSLQEIHKQKTLVNRLQGTVASIIEKEVKQIKLPDKIVWNITSAQMENANHVVNNDHYIGEYEPKSPYNKPLENNNMIYENRNFCTRFVPGSHHGDPTYVTAANVLARSPDGITPHPDSYPGTLLTSPSPHVHDQQVQYEMSPQDELSNKYNKATSPWDDHIEPLLKLFQNVGSSPLGKEQNTNDANSEYLLTSFSDSSVPRDNILDLSGGHHTTYTSSHDNTSGHGNAQQSGPMQEHSKSANLPSFMTLTSSKRLLQDPLEYGQGSGNIPVPVNNQLPHFNDITWSKLKEMNQRDSLKPQPQTSLVNRDYKMFAQAQSLNMMSGGQFHYASTTKQTENTYYSQEATIDLSQEKMVPGPLGVQSGVSQQQESQPEKEQQQNYEYKGAPQHEQAFVTLREHGPLTQQSTEEHQQFQNYKAFMAEGSSHYEGDQLHSPGQQQTSFTPSPTRDDMNKSSYTDLTPVQLPIHVNQTSPLSPPVHIMQQQQQQQHATLDHQNQVRQNYTALLSQTSYSSDQQQLQQQQQQQQQFSMQLPIPQYEQAKTKRTLSGKPATHCVSQKVTEAITQYLNCKNTHLSKETIPKVPLVIRHKLLASILTDKDGTDAESSKNQMSQSNLLPQPILPNTDGPLLPLQPERQSHSMSNPLLYGTSHRESSAGGTSGSSTLLNRTYSQPGCSTLPNHINRTLSQQDISLVANTGSLLSQTLLQPSISTINSELLNQIMPSHLPVPVPMPVPRLTSPVRPHKGIPRWSTPLQSNAAGAHFDSRVNQQKVLPPYGQATTHDPRTNKRKRKGLLGPACQRKQLVIIIQKADDEYYMGTNTHVNLRLPKRSHTCVDLGCLTAAKSDMMPQQRMRGRPPKNGSLVARKGSYKKGRYPCPVCGNFYAWKNYLRIHIAKHAKTKAEGPLVITEEPQVITEGPLVINDGPLVINEGPLVINEGPMVINEGHLVINEGPMVINEGPNQ